MSLDHFAVQLTRTRCEDFERDAQRRHIRRHFRSNGKTDQPTRLAVITGLGGGGDRGRLHPEPQSLTAA